MRCPPLLTGAPLFALRLPTFSCLRQHLLLPLRAFTKAISLYASLERLWKAPGVWHREPRHHQARDVSCDEHRARRSASPGVSQARRQPLGSFPLCRAETPMHDALPPPPGPSAAAAVFLRDQKWTHVSEIFAYHPTQKQQHLLPSAAAPSLSHQNYSYTFRLQFWTRSFN